MKGKKRFWWGRRRKWDDGVWWWRWRKGWTRRHRRTEIRQPASGLPAQWAPPHQTPTSIDLLTGMAVARISLYPRTQAHRPDVGQKRPIKHPWDPRWRHSCPSSRPCSVHHRGDASFRCLLDTSRKDVTRFVPFDPNGYNLSAREGLQINKVSS